MLTSCLNCGHHFKGNYCPSCGQKATVKKITFSTLLEDIFHFFTHLEKGFLFTTWNFLARPGISSINYIDGKRKEYQKPVSYFLIWTGLYFLIHNTIVNYFHYNLTVEIVEQLDMEEKGNILFRSHFTFFIIPVILVSALILYIIMARPRYNFIELITLCLYGTGTYFMMSLMTDMMLGILFKINILSINVFIWQAILSSLYNFWFSFDLFKRLHLRFFWIRLLAVSILVAITGWIIMNYLPLAWIYFTG